MRVCFAEPLRKSTVIGVHNIQYGAIYVTIAVFKQLAVIRKDTGDHPIVFGPIGLHGHSDTVAWSPFFSLLTVVLSDMSSPLSFGQKMRRPL